MVDIPSSRRGRRRVSRSSTEDGVSLSRGILMMLSNGLGPRSVAKLFGSVLRPRDLPFEGWIFVKTGAIGIRPGEAREQPGTPMLYDFVHPFLKRNICMPFCQ